MGSLDREQNLALKLKPVPLFLAGKASSEKAVDKESIRAQALLIFDEKQSFRKLGDIIYQLSQSGEIYVRRDALTVLFGPKITYGNILTYGGRQTRPAFPQINALYPLHYQ